MSQDFSSPKLPSPRLSCEALSSKATYESSRGSSESPLASGSFSMFSQYAGDYHNRSPQSQSPPYAGASSQPLQMIGAHQPHGTSPIGQPIHFTSGQFAGRTIRAELHEQQKADLGRKYARVDRRPLDPPPVVVLRLYQVFNYDTDQESEREIDNYDDIQVLGLVCTVDLFPVPTTNSPHKNIPRRYTGSGPTSHSAYSVSHFPSDPSRETAYQYAPSNAYSQPSPSHSISTIGSPLHVSASPEAYHPPSDIVNHIGEFPIHESSKVTHALVGATFVQPYKIDWDGKKKLMFVFADLAVKIEGSFVLRYRVFDLFSTTPMGPDHDGRSVQAECYGGQFRVYSTKEFPGLQASTKLTKHIALYGVRLNIRETERRRRKKGETGSSSPPDAPKGKRKHIENPENDEFGRGSDED